MEPQHWQRIAKLYDEVCVCERPRREREGYDARACEGDDDLKREVESLLDQDLSRDASRFEHGVRTPTPIETPHNWKLR